MHTHTSRPRAARALMICALLTPLLTATLASAARAAPPAGPGETSATRFARALAALSDRSPVRVATALWEALELAPLSVEGGARLEQAAAKLERSALPFVPGEAALARARLLLTHPEPEAVARAAALASSAGALSGGLVLGPLPGSGAGLALPEGLDAGATAPGKHGPTGWRAFSDAAPTGVLTLDDLLPSSGDLHVFVRAGLEVDRRVEATLVLGSNGPLAAWLDGAPLLEWDGERPHTDWQHTLPLALGPGRHELLLRVGHRGLAPELSARLVDGRGLLPAGVRWAAPAAPAPTPPTPTPAATTRPARGLWELARDDAERGRLGVWIVREAPTERVAARALEAAIAALEAGPDNPNKSVGKAELSYLLGRAERTDTSRAKAALREADRLIGGHAQALAALVALAERDGLGAEADALTLRLDRVEPGHPVALAQRALRRLELADAAAAVPVLAADPRLAVNARLVAALATLQERSQRIPEAARLFRELARLSGGASEPTQRAVALFRRAGQPDEAERALAISLARRPFAADLHLLRARVLASRGEDGLVRAIALLEALRPFHHQSPALEETRGRLLLLAGQRGRAIEAFDRALELAPQDRDLADYRSTLVEERGLSERWAEPVDLLVARSARTPRSEGGAGAVQLFERTATQVFASGLSSQFRQVALRIDQASAAERYETMAFPFTPGEDRLEVLEAEVLRKDGSRLRPQQVGEQRDPGKSEGVYTLTAYKVIRFPALEPGDIVHVQLRKDEIGGRNLFGDFFGVFFPFSSELLKVRVEAIIEAPAERELFFEAHGVPAPQVVREGGLQRLTFAADRLPGLTIEPSMPGYGDIGAWVSISTFQSWEALATWYRELILPQLEVPADLAHTARELTAKLGTLEERVAAIHRWVVTKTRYVGIEFGIHGFKPYKVAEVVQRGYGDCKDKASLLVAMLRSADIPAELVLVRTRDLGGLAGTPATLWAFNHAIAYVPALDLYLDGTAESSGLRELPELDQDALALRLDPWSAAPPILARIPMQSPADNKVLAEARFIVSADGDAEVELSETIAGSAAGRLRGRLQDPTRRDALIGGIIASQHPGTELISTSYENLEPERLGRPVVIRAKARMPRIGARSGDTLEIPMALEPGSRLKQMAPLATRRQPLILMSTELEENTDRYALPPGARPIELPAPVKLETPWGRYSRLVTVEGSEVVSRVLWELTASRIEPADYPAFRAFLEAQARAEAASLRIRLSP